ncbi:hypothetical protein [Gordonia sp. UBA6683]|uniref:hypothetical protein n=1 Tax=Gordonia sp. UBA6683 TaxID=1946577 RepID=UPI0025B85A6B|nr:hypothetical protein [Gordonia sp. UBA6683]
MSYNQTETYADVHFVAKHGGGDRIIVADNQPATLSTDNVEDEDGNQTPVLVAAVEAGNLVVEVMLDAAHVDQFLPPRELPTIEPDQLTELPIGTAVLWINRVWTRVLTGVRQVCGVWPSDAEWVCADGGFIRAVDSSRLLGSSMQAPARILYVPESRMSVGSAEKLIREIARRVPSTREDDSLSMLASVAKKAAYGAEYLDALNATEVLAVAGRI